MGDVCNRFQKSFYGRWRDYRKFSIIYKVTLSMVFLIIDGMKDSEIIFRVCDARIGYHARKVKFGPEFDLVSDFIANGLDGNGYSFKSSQMAIFIEPRIESGFPDLVLAEFNPDFYERWPVARNLLTSRELKLLSFLYATKEADYDRIRMSMHASPIAIAHSIDLLFDSELIDRDRMTRAWRPMPITKTYGVKRLIAVEAKVCNNDDVLEQASLNQWFASESYALTPVRPNHEFLSRARRAGIGMVAAAKGSVYRRCVKPHQFALPSSYASWQFNEWIGRRLAR